MLRHVRGTAGRHEACSRTSSVSRDARLIEQFPVSGRSWGFNVWMVPMVVRLDSTVRLNNGVEMPVLGLGTAGASGKACVAAVRAALDVGYRLVWPPRRDGDERAKRP